MPSTFAFLSLIIVFLCPYRPASATHCRNAEGVIAQTHFQEAFNGCLRPNVNTTALMAIAEQVSEWVAIAIIDDSRSQASELAQYLLVLIVFIPCIAYYRPENLDAETAARSNRVRLGATFLLFQVGFAMSIAPWLQAAFRQTSPCECRKWDAFPVYERVGTPWGMPSYDGLVAFVVALHLGHYVSIYIGSILAVAVLGGQLLLGVSSLGQVLGALGLATFLHVYFCLTPLYLRAMDLFLTVLGGLLTYFLVKEHDPSVDYSFGANWFVGISWMLFAILAIFVIYQFHFLRVILQKPSRKIHDVDFLYYLPANVMSPQHPNEVYFMAVAISALFAALTTCKYIAAEIL